jgi:hypothetical protein
MAVALEVVEYQDPILLPHSRVSQPFREHFQTFLCHTIWVTQEEIPGSKIKDSIIGIPQLISLSQLAAACGYAEFTVPEIGTLRACWGWGFSQILTIVSKFSSLD